jgi:hypothetical protein
LDALLALRFFGGSLLSLFQVGVVDVAGHCQSSLHTNDFPLADSLREYTHGVTNARRIAQRTRDESRNERATNRATNARRIAQRIWHEEIERQTVWPELVD